MDDKKSKHLEMVQAVINRMAGSSMTIKGWSITLVSALFALAAKDAEFRYVIVSYFSAGMFWFLDGYFLYQERSFRNLYNKIRVNQEESSNFSMDVANSDRGLATWLLSTFSPTLFLFHGFIIATISFIMLFFKKGGH